MEHPAGESDDGALRVDFDRRLKLEFHGSRITSDAGLLAYRELDDVLGLTDLAGSALSECRRGRNTRHLLTGLLHQSVFGRLAGYEDVNDADRLAHDPAMHAIVDRAGLEQQAASTSQKGRFETGRLTGADNQAALADLPGAWIDRVRASNLGDFLRALALPEAVKHWTLTTLRDRLVKIGARIARHGRSVTFPMAEVLVSRGLFQQILSAVTALRPVSAARC
jgi:hypothetical protein